MFILLVQLSVKSKLGKLHFPTELYRRCKKIVYICTDINANTSGYTVAISQSSSICFCLHQFGFRLHSNIIHGIEALLLQCVNYIRIVQYSQS